MLFLRFGDIPPTGASRNFRDSMAEVGVSVYEVEKLAGVYHFKDATFLFTGPGLLESGRPLYELEGTVIGHGSDGEPVIQVAQMKKLQRATLQHPVLGMISWRWTKRQEKEYQQWRMREDEREARIEAELTWAKTMRGNPDIRANPRPSGKRVGSATVRRAPDFESTGQYLVEFDDLPGAELTIFRDVSSDIKPWLWADDPNASIQGGFGMYTFLGFTMEEAVAGLEELLDA